MVVFNISVTEIFQRNDAHDRMAQWNILKLLKGTDWADYEVKYFFIFVTFFTRDAFLDKTIPTPHILPSKIALLLFSIYKNKNWEDLHFGPFSMEGLGRGGANFIRDMKKVL